METLRILVVDDEARMRKLVKDFLRRRTVRRRWMFFSTRRTLPLCFWM